MKLKRLVVAAAGIVAAAVALVFLWEARPHQDRALQAALAAIVEDYRKIIVLMDGAETLDEATRARCVAAGQAIFWRKHRALDDLSRKFSESSGRSARIQQLSRYLTND